MKIGSWKTLSLWTSLLGLGGSGSRVTKIDSIVNQIHHYLDSETEEAALERGLLEKLGCYYVPSADGVSIYFSVH